MKPGIIIALSASLVLVVGATWTRFASSAPAQNLVAVEQVGAESFQEVLIDFLESDATSTPSSTEPLNGTNLISRQMIMDYMELATGGQATEESVAALADRYVESVPTLHRAEQISYSDIKVTSNSQGDFQIYNNEISKIYEVYARSISRSNSQGGNLNSLNPSLYSTTLAFSNAYAEAASKLKKLSVPAMLVPHHLQLVNSFLSSAEGMKAISGIEEDSAAAFAGLITVSQNIEKEKGLLEEMERILITGEI